MSCIFSGFSLILLYLRSSDIFECLKKVKKLMWAKIIYVSTKVPSCNILDTSRGPIARIGLDSEMKKLLAAIDHTLF